MTVEQLKGIANAIAQTVAATPEGVPSGPLYAGLMGKIDLNIYNELVATLVRAGLVESRAHVLHATPKLMEICKPAVEHATTRGYARPRLWFLDTDRKTYDVDEASYRALADAVRTIEADEFNARDYYPLKDGEWDKAVAERRQHLEAIHAAKEYFLALAAHAAKAVKE